MIEEPEKFEFKPAVRTNTPMIIGISGASGSGKTFTALELAMGLAGTGRIAFIDTEGRRALHYADFKEFKFDHLDFQSPYTPARFLAALKTAAGAGYAVIIVDSFSDEYVGEGGLVDMKDAELPRVSGHEAAAWARPKAQHKLVTRWLRQSRVHVIFCLRAEEKVRLEAVVRNGRKQTVVVPIGWQPICEKNVPYEMTTSFMLTPDAPGIPKPIKIQEQHRVLFPPDRPVTRQTGEQLAAWCAGGAPAPIPPPGQLAAEIHEVHQRAFPEPEITRDGSGQLDSDMPYEPRGDPFDRGDPIDLGDHRDLDPPLSDELPMWVIETAQAAQESLVAFEEAEKSEKLAEMLPNEPGKPEIVFDLRNLIPNGLPEGMSWPGFGELLSDTIPGLGLNEVKQCFGLLQAHEMRTAQPAMYANLVGKLMSREHALGGAGDVSLRRPGKG